MRSKEATKRAARAYFLRNKDNPAYKLKRAIWLKKWRHANPDRYVSSNYRFNLLRAKSKHREMPMELSFEAYKALIEGKNCHYCGLSVFSSGSGLDRLDSNKGYIEGNCVPCCYRCNVMKGDLPTDEFYEQVERILAHRGPRL